MFKIRLLTVITLTSIVYCTEAQDKFEENSKEPRILSAYHGLDPLPPRATRLCGLPPANGQDGMPVTFSVQINSVSIYAEAFAVETSSGTIVTPLCATLRPAIEPLESRTILLIGPFSEEDTIPLRVKIVGELEDVDGNSLNGLKIEKVTPLGDGPSLVLAEAFSPNTAGLEEECPQETSQAIQLTWEGGVTGPNGAKLREPQRTAITILLDDGDSVHPLILADDDPDNHVIACIAEASEAVSVSVMDGFFYDPGNDANPATSIDIISKTKE